MHELVLDFPFYLLVTLFSCAAGLNKLPPEHRIYNIAGLFNSIHKLLKVNAIAELLTLIFKLYTLSYIFCNCTYVFTGTHAIFCN